jgi:hypothetical protein
VVTLLASRGCYAFNMFRIKLFRCFFKDNRCFLVEFDWFSAEIEVTLLMVRGCYDLGVTFVDQQQEIRENIRNTSRFQRFLVEIEKVWGDTA